MTNLTEQWRKGELIDGKKYYITFFDSEPFEAIFRAAEATSPFWKFEANGRQYCDESIYDCVKVLAPVPTFEEWQAKLEENAQLKKLLKDCLKSVKKDYDDYLTYTQSTIYQEISQALGEDK